MASESARGECVLCFHSQYEFLIDLEMNRKIEKYLQLKMEYSCTGICSNCHTCIEAFHTFSEEVHAAQKKFKEKISNNEQGDSFLKINSETGERDEGMPFSCSENVQDIKTENSKESIEKPDEKVPRKSKTTSKKHENSKSDTISSEIEKRMLEFYNIQCEKCTGGKFTSFKMLSNHYWVVHNTQGYIKCCKRNIRVNDKYYLRNHMFKHLQPETCRCMVCGKELSSTTTLKHHMILHKPVEERPYQCSKCSKKFCCKNDLKNHEKTIHVPENERVDHICDACGKVFQKIANLRYHYSTLHLQERKYICEICAKCFTTKSGLTTHINAAHANLSPIQCQICNKWLKTKDTFQKHWQLHQNHTYPCNQCGKVCNSSASLRSHLVKHSQDRPHSCTSCRKSFKTKTHLKNHSAQHLGGGHYKCPFCSKFFVNMSNFYTHRRKMHSSEKTKTIGDKATEDINEANVNAERTCNDVEFYKEECTENTSQIETINVGYTGGICDELCVKLEFKSEPSTPVGAETVHYDATSLRSVRSVRNVNRETVTNLHVCEFCGKRHESRQALGRHRVTHPEIPKPFVCRHCDEKFASPQARRRHQRKHPDIVHEWECRFCPQSFPQKTLLSKHVKVHAGEKLFTCESCTKRFDNRYSLLRHVKIHTGEAPYKCDVCEKGFLNSLELGRHMRNHTGEKPFKCPDCCRCFMEKSCLVKHAMKKHNALNI